MLLVFDQFQKSLAQGKKRSIYTSKEIYCTSQSDFGIYFREKLNSPMVYGEVPVYANEDLVVETGKLTPKQVFKQPECA